MLPQTPAAMRNASDHGGFILNTSTGSTTTSRRRQTNARTAFALRLDELLEGCADGDRAAFADLYDGTASQSFGLALRLVRDRTLAEDVVQEAYLTIWRKAASFDPRKGSGVGWILMIVHRTAVDHVRSAESRLARDDRWSREGSALHHAAADPTHDLVQASHEARVVRAALAGLAVRQREALELAYFDGYTYRQVAELLDIPLGTAKTRISSALHRLRESVAIQAVHEDRDADRDTETRIATSSAA